jgi:hypothetical protein
VLAQDGSWVSKQAHKSGVTGVKTHLNPGVKVTPCP